MVRRIKIAQTLEFSCAPVKLWARRAILRIALYIFAINYALYITKDPLVNNSSLSVSTSISLKNQADREIFWEQQAENLPWFKRWTKVLNWEEPFAHWFVDGQINASYACLDVHIKHGRQEKIAFYWEDERGNNRTVTYGQLFLMTNKYASIMRDAGVKKGDVVIVYLPMTPEAAAAMLAITRLGATQSVVFSGFSPSALQDRIADAQAKFVFTADFVYRKGRFINLKQLVDQALEIPSTIEKVFVIKRHEQVPALVLGRDVVMNDLYNQAADFVEPVPVESNHPLFILYTSGTTGKPKGITHSTGGYLTYVYATIKWAFNLQEDSIYWCTADIGWITGHSYVIYGPLMHGVSSIMYEGAPDFPAPDQWWKLIAKYKATIFYTSPTALRMFKRYDVQHITKHDLSSLKVLGSVGEPINPEVWQWYHDVIGSKRCPVIDTWWQTETGGFMIAPTAGLDLVALKPGSATRPMPCIDAEVVDERGNTVPAGTKGFLVVKNPWPGMTIGLYKDSERFKAVYWERFKGMYYSGDYAIKDDNGYFWLLGRADEVLNIAGHRIGTAEIESATVAVSAIAEAAAIGVFHPITGEGVVIFAIVRQGLTSSIDLEREIVQSTRKHIGSFVTPCGVYFVDSLPKTRSGKIMRRVLRAVLEGLPVGDVTTLENEASVDEVKRVYEQLQLLLSKKNNGNSCSAE